jgi:hypothetical protein
MKSNRKWSLIVLAIVVIPLALSLLIDERTKPISIAFIGFTNVAKSERPFALFVGTNSSPNVLRYLQHIERKSDAGWPVYTNVSTLPHLATPFVEVPAGRKFQIQAYPPTGGEPWRISIVAFEESRIARLRDRVGRFLYDLGLHTLGDVFIQGSTGRFVTGPEMPNERQTTVPVER